MAMCIAVESVEKGDRIEVWYGDSAIGVVVRAITEGVTIRTLQVCSEDASFELSVQRGHTVNLLC